MKKQRESNFSFFIYFNMKIIEMILIGMSLAMDAFTVSICKSVKKKINIKRCVIIALSFSIFQVIMPYLGFTLGLIVSPKLIEINHYISSILLFIVGLSMIFDTFNDSDLSNKIDFKTLILLSIATSIDAFAVGITFAFRNVNIILILLLIFIITFVLCFIGGILGGLFNNVFGKKLEILGGLVLIIDSIKIIMDNILN